MFRVLIVEQSHALAYVAMAYVAMAYMAMAYVVMVIFTDLCAATLQILFAMHGVKNRCCSASQPPGLTH